MLPNGRQIYQHGFQNPEHELTNDADDFSTDQSFDIDYDNDNDLMKQEYPEMIHIRDFTIHNWKNSQLRNAKHVGSVLVGEDFNYWSPLPIKTKAQLWQHPIRSMA